MTANQRYAKAESAAWTGLIGNVCIAAVKAGVGVMAGSKSLLADACRSASEAAASFVSLTGIRRCRQFGTPDAPVPASRGRSEAATGVLASLLLMIVGLEIGISAIKSIADGVDESPSWPAAAVVLVVFILKEVGFSTKERGIDFYASLAALVGTGGSMLGHPLGLHLLYYLDPAASLIIVVIVFSSGYRVASASVMRSRFLEVEPSDLSELKAVVLRMEGVIDIEVLRAREHGHYAVAEVVISVNPRISVLEGNEIAKRVREFLMKRFNHMTEVTVHVEPYDPGYPYKTNHDSNQEQLTTLLQ
ncbi:cation diffusion facilitator family transporter [Paenibacillus sacheonensis]|uniref:Cation diffusion facilitator family transporter n=1 Tax=Paenibacillus sacheonensis TaxID=742054 RepID=A0A7X5BX19_9BACL|nr:cation diffusion facilitator family transporter [Paenibacillus sacheonensis]MBM7563739.1 cation diffusion facilitator family transporter [Paenibacillus sacheonensis]NBC67906.1 cation diffusion facilitator family transporter [Paenibacillus sacheonensis]